ncbi:MAG: autotransporter outer membrane beta-barrel domain-containing protein [Deltaproteobacteria bacterium]|nr:autotransporter outer membrane beta-barrel domain-containing protein [Deltaproteobacteria bacterium]
MRRVIEAIFTKTLSPDRRGVCRDLVRVCLVVLALSFAFHTASNRSTAAAAAEINYPTDGTAPVADEYAVPGADAILPAGSSGNRVVIDGDLGPSLSMGGMTVPHYGSAYGGAGSAEASGNTLELRSKANLAFGAGGFSLGGSASGNTVVVDGGVAPFGIMGAGAYGGDAIDNVVRFAGGLVGEIGVGYSPAGVASGNKAYMSGGQILAALTGGSSLTGSATGNLIEVTGGSIGTFAVSGYVYESGDATGNSLSFSGGVMGDDSLGAPKGFLAAGYATDGKVSGNDARISGGIVYGGTGSDDYGNPSGLQIPEGVYGGLAIEGDAEKNSLAVAGGDVYGFAAAGRTEEGDAVENTVAVSGGVLHEGIFGGAAFGTGDADANAIAVGGGSIYGPVHGGWALGGGDAEGNGVEVKGGNIIGPVVGGVSEMGKVTGNEVTISGGNLSTPDATDDENDIAGGVSEAGDAVGNRVTITGGNISAYDDVFGGIGEDGTVSGNVVRIAGGTMVVRGSIIGGSVNEGESKGNSVVVTGGNVSHDDYSLPGGGTHLVGGEAYGSAASASENSVEVSGGDVAVSNIVGGFVGVTGNSPLDATDNRVTISGGRVDANIYGGLTQGSGNAVRNTVTLTGAPVLSPGRVIQGGRAGTDADAFAGNTLNVWGYTGGTVGSVGNFEYYDFVLPSSTSGRPALTSSGTVTLGDGAARGSVVRISTAGVGAPLDVNRTITLIAADVMAVTGPAPTEAAGNHGELFRYDWALSLSGTSLSATLRSVSVNPLVKAMPEGVLGGMALVSQGADLASGQGVAAASSGARSASGLASFGAVMAGTSRYETGSRLDVNGVSLIAGLAWGSDLNPGRFVMGAFFEFGSGNYDTRNSLGGVASVDGDGDTDYVGGGILGRIDFGGAGSGNFYAEFSGRLGKAKNDFSSDDLRDRFGMSFDYDVDAMYYGAHLGAGYVWGIGGAVSLDLYGKYLWTRLKGDDFALPTGAPVEIRDVDSHRLRGGARLSYAVNDRVKTYVGAAFDHEFDGEAMVSVYGHYVPSPDLKGGTGIAELGVSIAPSDGIALELGVQGYAGKRKGVSGSLAIRFDF